MSLEITVSADIKAAMLAKNEVSLRSLRAIKSAILIANTAEGKTGSLTVDDEVKLLQKLVKQRKDSLEIYTTQNRPELAIKEQEEIAIIEKYLPAQLSNEELHSFIKQLISENGISSMAEMGKLIGLTNKALAGKAEGKAISTAVKEILSTI
jgi:uncharacterized protein